MVKHLFPQDNGVHNLQLWKQLNRPIGIKDTKIPLYSLKDYNDGVGGYLAFLHTLHFCSCIVDFYSTVLV